MTPETIAMMQSGLPDELIFPYFADRESAWLLSRRMAETERVAALKAGPLAHLLERPSIRPIVAECGGVLAREDVAAVARADGGGDAPDTAAAVAGILASYEVPWSDFGLSFTAWGIGDISFFSQLSRDGGNLVVQLGFPSDHAALMGEHLGGVTDRVRDLFSSYNHPVRKTGRPTLAWARLDVEDGVALIEEVQSDWLRIAKIQLAELARFDPRSRHLRGLRAYTTEAHARYAAVWPRAMLLAAIVVLVEYLDVRDIFYHQAEAGAQLKHIDDAKPPVSLYTALPKRFGFVPTDEAPPFLKKPRRRDLARLKRTGDPVFWRLTV